MIAGVILRMSVWRSAMAWSRKNSGEVRPLSLILPSTSISASTERQSVKMRKSKRKNSHKDIADDLDPARDIHYDSVSDVLQASDKKNYEYLLYFVHELKHECGWVTNAIEVRLLCHTNSSMFALFLLSAYFPS